MSLKTIPIRFRFLKLPVTWEVQNNKKLGTVLCGRLNIKKDSPKVPLQELDGWGVRHEFFGLSEDDPNALASFLTTVGVWSTDHEEAALDPRRFPCSVHLDDVWQFRADLRDALTHTHRQSFLTSVAPKLAKPKTLSDLEREPYSWVNNFPLRFELSDVAAGVVTIMNARRMLFATVLADVASGIRFKICKRKDCQRPFAVTSKHERDYHTDCAHVIAQRAYLKKEAAKKRAALKQLYPGKQMKQLSALERDRVAELAKTMKIPLSRPH